ncbi:MAG: hypothetical protein DRN14_05040 [Thermoplasmata archaeon]|nr:MAG: hypothetical protein DRN14_05040 [Thermoplasmata archaeon]
MLFGRPFKLFGLTVWHEPVCLFNFEWVFNTYGPFEYVVELGTGTGGLSLFLYLQQVVRGGRFVTFDKCAPSPILKRIGVDVRICDIFREVDSIQRILQNHRSFLYCDNGDKVREVTTFAPHLTPGSVLGVDDWGFEITEDDVSDVLQNFGLVTPPFLTKQRFWVRK